MIISGLHNLQILRGLSGNRSILSCTSNRPNVNLWNKDDGSGRQQWDFVKLPNEENIYNIIIKHGVPSDKIFLSCNSDGSTVDLWNKDDGSGRQRWVIIPVNNSPTCNTYLIRVDNGVSSDRKYLSCTPDGLTVNLWNKDDGSGRQRWQIQGVWPQPNK